MERFYNGYLEAKSIVEETFQLQKKVESSQIESDRQEAEDEDLTELELEINESETTFAGSDSIDVDDQMNNLKNIAQSAIANDYVNVADTTCNEIGSLTEKLTTEVDRIRADIMGKSQFQLENLVQNDEMENALRIIKKSSDSLKVAELDRMMLKHRVIILKRFITAMRESRTKIKAAVAYYARNPERLEKQEQKIQHEVAVLKEQKELKTKNIIENVKKDANTEFSDTILKIFAGQLENEITLLQTSSNELDYFKKLQGKAHYKCNQSVSSVLFCTQVPFLYISKTLIECVQIW